MMVRYYKFSRKSLESHEKLSQTVLFCHVGEELNGPYVFVSSWSDAINICDQLDSENAANGAANQMATQLPHLVYQKWNDIADPVREKFIPLIERKSASARI